MENGQKSQRSHSFQKVSAKKKELIEKCIFCKIVAKQSPANVIEWTNQSVVIVPLNPHVPGHVLFIPRKHYSDATLDPANAGLVMSEAARYLRRLDTPGNILTSAGEAATQSVFHMHIHVLPRGIEDGLDKDWPWMREGL